MEPKDIELVMQQANVSKAKVGSHLLVTQCTIHYLFFPQAIKALKNNKNDIVNAIMVSYCVVHCCCTWTQDLADPQIDNFHMW